MPLLGGVMMMNLNETLGQCEGKNRNTSADDQYFRIAEAIRNWFEKRRPDESPRLASCGANPIQCRSASGTVDQTR